MKSEVGKLQEETAQVDKVKGQWQEMRGHATTLTLMKPENMMPSERSQLQKATHCMIPFIWNFQDRPIYKDRKQVSSCLGRELGMGEDYC